MLRGVVFLPAICALWVLTASAAAVAQPASAPAAIAASQDSPLDQAKAAQTKAAQLFREGNFSAAADLLRFAYASDSRPILLFNAGQAYRKAERALDAKTMYEQFLVAAPEHPLGPEARGYIKDMELFLAMQARAKEVALELEEQLAAKQTIEKEAALKLEEERRRSLQIKQDLLHTQTQLENDRKKLASRRRWLLGIGITAAVVVAGVSISVGATFYDRASTNGGTVDIEK